jgi:N-formylglutamate amidohydrolase
MKTYSLEEISLRLGKNALPFSGITPLGSCEFHIRAPASYAGLVLHSGHRVRPEILEAMAVGEQDRFREEDPFMERFIAEFPVQLIARDSRFEYDLNWEMEKSIYRAGLRKWGLQVWKRALTRQERELSLAKYREFHSLLDMTTEFLLKQGSPALIFDMHSFCYQREVSQDWHADDKPDINLGTRDIRREYFTFLLDALLADLAGTEIDGHPLRVAENDLFPGGYITRKYARRYPEQVLVLALEFKKIFIDEWTGEVYRERMESLISSFRRAAKRLISLSAAY